MTGQPAGIPADGPTNLAMKSTDACCDWFVQFWATTVAVAVCPGAPWAGSKLSEVIWTAAAHAAAAACSAVEVTAIGAARQRAAPTVSSLPKREPPCGSAKCPVTVVRHDCQSTRSSYACQWA